MKVQVTGATLTPPVISFHSVTSFRIEIFGNGYSIGIGTAFIYERNGDRFLVTNWHNVTGLNPITNYVIDPNSILPDELLVRPLAVKDAELSMRFEQVDIRIPLYEDGDVFAPRWFVHPSFGSEVDVVAIPWSYGPEFHPIRRGNSRLLMTVGQDVFILGFPRNLSGGHFPIWKRGSIASEPYIDLGKLPKLYVDTATKEGMSGSPVFIITSGPASREGDVDGGLSIGALSERFVGIYSGRVGVKDLEAQLGVVWKESALIDIIEARKLGEPPCLLCKSPPLEPTV